MTTMKITIRRTGSHALLSTVSGFGAFTYERVGRIRKLKKEKKEMYDNIITQHKV
jgi:hypothetical protein